VSKLLLEIEVRLKVIHHVAKFAEGERLIAVAHGFLRAGMYLDK